MKKLITIILILFCISFAFAKEDSITTGEPLYGEYFGIGNIYATSSTRNSSYGVEILEIVPVNLDICKIVIARGDTKSGTAFTPFTFYVTRGDTICWNNQIGMVKSFGYNFIMLDDVEDFHSKE